MSDKTKKRLIISQVSDLENFTFGTNWTDKESSSQTSRTDRSFTVRSNKKAQSTQKDKNISSERDPVKRRRFRGKEFKKGGESSSLKDSFKPVVKTFFYPEEAPFAALLKAMCESFKTYQLFDIAKLILLKEKLFVIVVEAPEKEGQKSPYLYRSQVDGLPFINESEAVAHVTNHFITKFFEVESIQVDPPKGNFQVVNRSKVSGKIIGSPNYHRYAQLLEQHYLVDGGKMNLQTFAKEIEAVRDPKIIQEWLDSMKEAKKYTLKADLIRNPIENPDVKSTPPSDSGAVAPNNAENPITETNASTESELETDKILQNKVELPTFNLLEDAQQYLLSHHKNRIVTAKKSIRFSGKYLKDLPDGPLKQSILSSWNLQNKFPLDTANNIRGRLRREGFNVFKKGPQGISYACFVRRRFIEEGQIFADSIQQLVDFIGRNQGCNRKELPKKLLGLSTDDLRVESSDNNDEPINNRAEKLKKFQQLIRDLKWLLSEGYVTEFENGDLFLSVSSYDSYSDR